MLESNTGTVVMQKWYDMRTQDVVEITTRIQIALHYNQVRLLATHYSTPNNQTASTKSILSSAQQST